MDGGVGVVDGGLEAELGSPVDIAIFPPAQPKVRRQLPSVHNNARCFRAGRHKVFKTPPRVTSWSNRIDGQRALSLYRKRRKTREIVLVSDSEVAAAKCFRLFTGTRIFACSSKDGLSCLNNDESKKRCADYSAQARLLMFSATAIEVARCAPRWNTSAAAPRSRAISPSWLGRI